MSNLNVFGLLKPALQCCNRDRPDHLTVYLTEFIAAALDFF